MAASGQEATEVKHFAVHRAIEPGTTWQDIDAGAVKVMVTMFLGDIEPGEAYDLPIAGVRWFRTYWEPEGFWGLCLYQGTDAEQIGRWNQLCGAPFTEIREIGVEEPLAPVRYHSGFHADPTVSRLVVLESPASERPGERLAALGVQHPVWIRSYIDPASDVAISLHQADLPSDEVVRTLESEGWKVRRVVEITPNDYVDIE